MKQTVRRVLLGTAMIALFATGLVIGQNKFSQPKSIIHVVTVKWKADSTPAQRQAALDGVKTMAAKIPGMTRIWLKTIKVQSPTQDQPFDAAFVMEFKDQAAFDKYADDPAHKEWEKIYLAIRETSRSHDITNP
jgi:hypothetical protein